MNKRLIMGMFAAAGVLLAASCSEENLNDVQSGNEVTVSFTIGLDGVSETRAISDGTSADKLIYAVFDASGNRLSGIAQVVKENVTFPTTETIALAKGQTYKVAFWAQDTDCGVYTVSDAMTVTVSYASASNNDETRDAFYKTIEFTVSGSTSMNVVLERPFAQINVGVTEDDWKAAVASGITISTSSVVIKNAGTQIDLLTGNVSGEPVEVTYAAETIPATKTLSSDTGETLSVTVDGTTTPYKWLSMSYILVNDTSEGGYGAAKTTLESLEYTFATESTENTAGKTISFSDGLTSVPVQRNYRTNIIGQILTGNVSFNISIDPIYDGDYIYPDTLEEQLKMAAAYSGTVTLTEDVALAESLAVAEGVSMTIDLNGHSLTVPQIDVSAEAMLALSGSEDSSDQLILTTSINASSNSTVSVDGVTIVSDENGIYSGDDQTNVTVSVTDSEITAVQYGVALRGTGCSLTIDGTKITSTSDEDGNYGYGVLLRGDDSELTITNSEVATNSPAEEDDDAGYYPQAYGIVVYGDNSKATIDEVTITTAGYGSHGVYAAGDGEVTVSNTTISTTGKNSGGIYTAIDSSCKMTIDNVTITTEGLRARGIWTEGSGSELIISSSTITATGEGVCSYYRSSSSSKENVKITITDSEITVNNNGNSSVSGVAIYSNTSTLAMLNSTVTMSETDPAATTMGVTSQGSNNTVSLDNTTVISNGATNSYGAYIRGTENQVSITNGSSVSAAATSRLAYAIYLPAASTYSSVTIDGSAISSTTSGTYSRGIRIESGATNATVTMTNSSITSTMTGASSAIGIDIRESTAHATIDSATANAITADTNKYYSSSTVTVTD